MLYYFERDHYKGRSGNFLNIATALSNEYKSATKYTINSREDFDSFYSYAQDRNAWKQLTSTVVAEYIESQEAKALKQTEARKDKIKNAKTALSDNFTNHCFDYCCVYFS